jgi:two-component system NtrC family sensor kinase
MAKRKKSVRTPVKRHSASKPRKRTADVDLKTDNARLKRELKQAREARFREAQQSVDYQTATADVLSVISRSTRDVQPVFDAIARSAARLFAPCEATLTMLHNGQLQWNATASLGRPVEAIERTRSIYPIPFDTERSPSARAIHERRIIEIADARAPGTPENTRRAQSAGEFRAITFVPMVRDDVGIGTIILTHPKAGFKLSPKQLALVQTFANQAVIAIQNAQLFRETQEALEEQTATADILKVIASSPEDVQPVFDAIAQRSNRLIDGLSTAVYSFVDGSMYLEAFTPTGPEADAALQASFPRPLSGAPWADRILRGEIVQIADVEVEWAEQSDLQEIARLRGFRSLLFVPLLRDGTAIGQINVSRRERGTFSAHHIRLLRTFADQAVIAIHNVRLFDEVAARTRELSQSLESQTAISEVLQFISSSIGELQPVFSSILRNAMAICDAQFGNLLLYDGEGFVIGDMHNSPPAYVELFKDGPLKPGPDTALGRLTATRRAVQVADVAAGNAPVQRDPLRVATIEMLRARTLLAVPMLKEDELIGAIIMYRQHVKPFSDRQLDLVSGFARQAVIAVQNMRLVNELRQRTDNLTEALQQQTATANVLKVISRSTFNLQTVLHTLVKSAARLCDAEKGTITRQRGEKFYRAESFGFSDQFMDLVKSIPVTPDRGSATGRALLEGTIVHIPDVTADPDYTFTEGQRIGDFRTILGVPMMREGVPVGVIVLTRSEARPFTDKQVELVTTFADQAAIAIENVRLFESVEARTQELAKSLDELRAAQDRLVQTEKLASLGQLTAGIAHEIKNPLNFVNNFSAVSAELTDELNELLKSAGLSQNMRSEVEELTRLLKDNLEKVVQHGKRADSIVKNMLLHSRESSGEVTPTDINSLLDESLNLAYHGARAEKPGFNIELRRDFDSGAGSIELFPQEITRALLNVISNGFYAATTRSKETGEPDFRPVLRASTKDIGGAVEIRVRDNGTGIPAELTEKIFNPFFTTKPAGEGTGLGLSMSHDIIVKQHGGTIEVETKPGEFTEFRIVLPRISRGPLVRQ